MTNVALGPGMLKKAWNTKKTHRNVGEERRTRRSISSHRSYVIEDGDLVVKDDSDVDEDWDKRLLQEENEDEDDQEFFL